MLGRQANPRSCAILASKANRLLQIYFHKQKSWHIHDTGLCPLGAKLTVLWSFLHEALKVAKNLYVGNLPYSTSNSDLERMFEAYGSVKSAQVIMDRETGRSKGFGFVEMVNDQEAQAAIAALNGKDVDGRALTVNEARPREDRGGGGGGGRGGYGGRGGAGGGRGGYGGGGGGKRY